MSWRKSSWSMNNGNCVEAADGERAVRVRDSAGPGGPVLSFSPAAWREFTGRLR